MTFEDQTGPTTDDADMEAAFGFLDGTMPAAARDEYAARLATDTRQRDALASALALGAAARLGLENEDVLHDPALCAQMRPLLPAFARGGVSLGQRGDVEEHVARCAACARALMAAQQREAHPGFRWAAPIAGILLLGVGALGGWALSDAPSATAPGEATVLSASLRHEVIELVDFGKSQEQMRAAAALVVERIAMEPLLRADLPRQALSDLKSCIQLIGRGRLRSPPAIAWMRHTLLHPSPTVRAEAAIWYPLVDPEWEADDQVRGLMDAALKIRKDQQPRGRD